MSPGLLHALTRAPIGDARREHAARRYRPTKRDFHDMPALEYTLNSNNTEHRRLRTQAANLRAHTKTLLDATDLKPASSAIDLGCGPGGALDLLAERIGADGKVIGVDFDAASVAGARAFADERELINVEVIQADARHTELPSSSVDVVHARLLLANIPRPDEVVTEMARLVRPGGWVAVLEPDVALRACYPPHPGLEQLTELLVTVARRGGADPCIGRRLPHLFATAGLINIGIQARADVCPPRHAQRVVCLDLIQNISHRIVAQGPIDQRELDRLDRDARRHLDDQDTIVVPVTYFLAWARKPRR